MKTFKQHIKEVMSPLGINTAGADGKHVGDGAVGLANIEDADVLKKVNAYVGSIATKEYLNPQGEFSPEISSFFSCCLVPQHHGWYRYYELGALFPHEFPRIIYMKLK